MTAIWNILCWNMRGLNSDDKQIALKNKIQETGCSLVCVQETKMEYVDQAFIRRICPKRFDTFEFVPSIGASGGLLTI